jgi:ankyrin repeat protein
MVILLKHGWSVNEPIDPSGRIVLHQAVSLWTGSYRWNLDLRASVTAFLCEKGANPSIVNREGMSSYDLALASDHQDLIALLEERLRFKGLGNIVVEPAELSAYPS